MACTVSDHVPTVSNGVLNHISATVLEKGDARSGGCMRALWYHKVARVPEVMANPVAIANGKALDAELTSYMRTGIKHLSALALSGLHIVPDPGPDLLLQHSINGYLTCAGVPFNGTLDCSHTRGVNKGGTDILEMYDPPGTVEIIDWKFKSKAPSATYAGFVLEPGELIQSIQMSSYGMWARTAYPDATHVRLSHGVFFGVGAKPRKVTKLHVIDDVVSSWEYTEALARTFKDVVRETDADRVDANIHACGKYGGCQHKQYCSAFKVAYADQTSAALFGETLAKEIGASMGLMSTIPGMQPQQVVVSQQPQVTIDLRQQLADEEQRLRTQATQTNAGVTMDFAAAWKAIEASGRGYPALGGAAAVQRAALVGQQIPAGAHLQGAGDLASILMADPAHVIQLGQELSPQAPTTQQIMHVTRPPSVLPPDAPQNNPALAAQPMPGWTPQPAPGQVVSFQGQQYMQQQVNPQTITSQYVPQAPLITNVPAQQVQSFVQNATQPPVAEAPKKRRGRPPRVQPPVAGVATPLQTQQLTVGGVIGAQGMQQIADTPMRAVLDEESELEVYVDCIPNGEFEPINAYVEHLLGVLCEKFIPAQGLKDVRCAPKDSALGYGGWKGAIRAIIIEQPPVADTYVVDTRGNEIMEVVADALLQVCNNTQSRYVRGVR